MNQKPLKVEPTAVSIVKIVSILFGFYLLFLLREVALIVLTAIVLASAIEPMTAWLKGHGFSRLFAVITIYLTALLTILGFIYFLAPSLVAEVINIVNTLPEYLQGLEQAGVVEEENASFLFGGLQTIPLNELLTQLQQSSQQLTENAFRFLATIFGGLVSFILIIILSFYLAVQEEGVANFLRIITPHRYETYVISLWKRTQKKIGAWLQGQLILSLIVGSLSFIGLIILGVPNPLVLALIAAIFELIPLFGPILAAIPAVAFGFIDGGLTLGLLVAGLYVIIQQLESHVFHPIVANKVVGVPAVVAIIALLVGGQLAGFLGIILAVPIAAGLMELLNDIATYKHDTSKSPNGFGISASPSSPKETKDLANQSNHEE